MAVVDFAIGAGSVDEEYLFAEVSDLVLMPDHRFVVVDTEASRVAVFGREGHFVSEIGRPGEGPGEFHRPPRSASVSPDGEVWVEIRNYQVYVPTPSSHQWSYSRTVSVGRERQVYGRPMFASNGATAVRSGGWRDALVWIVDGEIVREDTLPSYVPSDEMGYGVFWSQRMRDGTRARSEVPGPYHPRDLLRLSGVGVYAVAVTSRYAINLFGDRGVRFATIRREDAAPRISLAERRRAEHVVDSLVAFYKQFGAIYTKLAVPELKPPIEELWYDEDSRLWVQLSRPDTDSLARAHVYSDRGRFLFAAAWPRDVSLVHGAIRDTVAVGRRIDVLDVPTVVRMTFARRD